MKKFVALLLALAMVFALCACGNSNSAAPKQDDAAESSQPSDNASDNASENQSAADLSALKVGFIFLHDENSTYDLNFMNAAKEACETLGVESVFKTNIPEDQSCYEAAAELVGAVLELEHTVIQGGCAAGQLSASGLGGVCAVSGRSHAVGVLADAGHEELYLAQIFFQGADAGHILAVGGLIDQLVVDLLLGVAVGELFQPAHDEIGRKALHQAQSGLKVVVGPGSREVERDIQLAGLELRSLLPDGAHHRLSGSAVTEQPVWEG